MHHGFSCVLKTRSLVVTGTEFRLTGLRSLDVFPPPTTCLGCYTTKCELGGLGPLTCDLNHPQYRPSTCFAYPMPSVLRKAVVCEPFAGRLWPSVRPLAANTFKRLFVLPPTPPFFPLRVSPSFFYDHLSCFPLYFQGTFKTGRLTGLFFIFGFVPTPGRRFFSSGVSVPLRQVLFIMTLSLLPPPSNFSRPQPLSNFSSRSMPFPSLLTFFWRLLALPFFFSLLSLCQIPSFPIPFVRCFLWCPILHTYARQTPRVYPLLATERPLSPFLGQKKDLARFLRNFPRFLVVSGINLACPHWPCDLETCS